MTALDDRTRRKSDPADLIPIRALVVDDDENYRAFVCALLRRAGIKTEVASDGRAALELTRSGASFDLFLIDLEMPRLNGLELIRELRSDDATASGYAVMLTGRGETETKIAALTAGFDDFLVKSATELELVAKIAASKRLVVRQQTIDATLRELRGLASTDELTGLLNRRFFFEEAPRVLAASSAVSLVLFDLDGFKVINDTYGHLAGDHVLRDVAAVLRRDTRYEDFVVRFGGDEFVMLTHDLSLDDLHEIVSRITRQIAALRWRIGEAVFGIGVSAGVATSRLLQNQSLTALLDAADRDLYKTKYVKRAPETSGRYEYGRTEAGDVVEFPRSETHSQELHGRTEGEHSNG